MGILQSLAYIGHDPTYSLGAGGDMQHLWGSLAAGRQHSNRGTNMRDQTHMCTIAPAALAPATGPERLLLPLCAPAALPFPSLSPNPPHLDSS